MENVKVLHSLPKGLLDTPINQLHDFLKGPTLIHIKGDSKKTIFISTLLHGNETSGVLALNRFLKQYENKKPPYSLCLFYGNTLAAAHGQRHLTSQRDWNRIWSPEELPECPEKKIATQVLKIAAKLPLMANIDIHNNTGNNPPYGCVNKLAPNFLKLAHIFDEKIIYFTEPHQVQSMAFAKFCPSMTIEAGMPGEENGIYLILKFLNKLMTIKDFTSLSSPQNLKLYHTVATVKLPMGTTVDFDDNQHSFNHYSLRRDLERLNFKDIPQDTHWGYSTNPLLVTHFKGHQVFHDFFQLSHNHITTKSMFTPCMLTKDQTVLKSDCLCYIMEHISDPQAFLKECDKD